MWQDSSEGGEMTHCLGVDIGNDTTTWTRSERTRDTITIAATGEFASVVGLDPTGALAAAGTGIELEHLTTNFVDTLGRSEPIIVGQTPYGVEALIASLISAAIAANHADTATPPDAVVLVYPDDMDDFRLSLLDEAAKIAGLPAQHTIVMSRSDARAHTPEGSASAGAATAAWANVPIAPAAGASGTATVAAAGAATAAGVTAAALHLSADTTASAATATAGPAGTTLGPAGTPLAPTAGPAGTSIGTSGPAGTSIGPAGATGTPITPAGPTGAPITSTGPAGTPLDTATNTGSTSGTTTATTAARIRPRWFPAAVAAGAVAVVAVVAVVVASASDNPPPETATAVATTIIDSQSATGDPETPAATTAIETTPGPAAFDTSAVIGTWETECEPFIALDGASAGRYVISDAGPNQLTMVIQGVDYQTPDCSDGGSVEISQEYPLVAVADTSLTGRRALQVTSPIGPAFLAVGGDRLDIAFGADAASASEIYELVRK